MFKFGVEYTFCPTARVGHASYEDAQRVAKGLDVWYGGGTDGDCLELPSKPMTNLKKHEKWVKKLFQRAHKAGYRGRVTERYNGETITHGTGGGHIHVAMPQDARPFVHVAGRMIEFFTDRPFIGWFFNEFCDDNNAVFFATDGRNPMRAVQNAREEMRNVRGKFGKHEQNRRRIAYYMKDQSGIGWSDTVIRFNSPGSSGNRAWNLPKTMEMRFFDAPRSPKQALEHIEFAKAIYKLCASRKPLPKRGFKWNSESAVHIREDGKNTERTIRQFKLMIRELGLDWKTYRKYVRNYLDRVTSGVLN